MDPGTLVALSIGGVVVAMGIVLGAVYAGWNMREAEVEREQARADELDQDLKRALAELEKEREDRKKDREQANARALGARSDVEAIRKNVAADAIRDDDARLNAGLLLAEEAANGPHDDGGASSSSGESVGSPVTG